MKHQLALKEDYKRKTNKWIDDMISKLNELSSKYSDISGWPKGREKWHLRASTWKLNFLVAHPNCNQPNSQLQHMLTEVHGNVITVNPVLTEFLF